jgi:hypothetical protein
MHFACTMQVHHRHAPPIASGQCRDLPVRNQQKERHKAGCAGGILFAADDGRLRRQPEGRRTRWASDLGNRAGKDHGEKMTIEFMADDRMKYTSSCS